MSPTPSELEDALGLGDFLSTRTGMERTDILSLDVSNAAKVAAMWIYETTPQGISYEQLAEAMKCSVGHARKLMIELRKACFPVKLIYISGSPKPFLRVVDFDTTKSHNSNKTPQNNTASKPHKRNQQKNPTFKAVKPSQQNSDHLSNSSANPKTSSIPQNLSEALVVRTRTAGTQSIPLLEYSPKGNTNRRGIDESVDSSLNKNNNNINSLNGRDPTTTGGNSSDHEAEISDQSSVPNSTRLDLQDQKNPTSKISCGSSRHPSSSALENEPNRATDLAKSSSGRDEYSASSSGTKAPQNWGYYSNGEPISPPPADDTELGSWLLGECAKIGLDYEEYERDRSALEAEREACRNRRLRACGLQEGTPNESLPQDCWDWRSRTKLPSIHPSLQRESIQKFERSSSKAFEPGLTFEERLRRAAETANDESQSSARKPGPPGKHSGKNSDRNSRARKPHVGKYPSRDSKSRSKTPPGKIRSRTAGAASQRASAS